VTEKIKILPSIDKLESIYGKMDESVFLKEEKRAIKDLIESRRDGLKLKRFTVLIECLESEAIEINKMIESIRKQKNEKLIKQ
jgi:hypothetical protein